jgi:hypothetical protein
MKKLRVLIISCLLIGFFCAAASRSFAQQQGYDISSGGQPTITGGLNGTVTGSGDPTQNLAVTINFGEVTPANSNQIVKITVPIAVRSLHPYQVTATATTSFSTNTGAVQATDIGFGVVNMRPLGFKAQQCSRSTHLITTLFNNDPALIMTINSAGRAAYNSTISNVGNSTLLMTGPKLTQGTGFSRTTEDGWVFNAVFTISPQFYESGNFSLTLSFSIAAGPSVQC